MKESTINHEYNLKNKQWGSLKKVSPSYIMELTWYIIHQSLICALHFSSLCSSQTKSKPLVRASTQYFPENNSQMYCIYNGQDNLMISFWNNILLAIKCILTGMCFFLYTPNWGRRWTNITVLMETLQQVLVSTWQMPLTITISSCSSRLINKLQELSKNDTSAYMMT